MARCSASASAKMSAIESRYRSWPGPSCRPITDARSSTLTISRNHTRVMTARSMAGRGVGPTVVPRQALIPRGPYARPDLPLCVGNWIEVGVAQSSQDRPTKPTAS